jgi:ribosomal protein S18 acetylase RimI-like enzyme
MGKEKEGNPQELSLKSQRGPTQSVTIGPADLSDGTYIAYLSDHVFCIYGSYGPVISQWFRSHRCLTLVAYTEKGPVGFVMTGPLLIDRGLSVASEVLAIAVDPGHQAKGIGSMLLRAIEEQAQKMHVEQLVLHTASNNGAALRLFEAHGFRLIKSISQFYPKGQDALEMMKKLSPKKGFSTTG